MGKTGVIITLLVLIAIGVTIYFLFFYIPKCSDINCWELKLEKCRKAKYINSAPDINWQYIIKNNKADNCIVNVKILDIKQGLQKTQVLEGKSMDCSLPLAIKMAPEADLNLCHGRLKEEMQTLMLENSHRYVFGNINEMGEALKGAGVGNEIIGQEITTEPETGEEETTEPETGESGEETTEPEE